MPMQAVNPDDDTILDDDGDPEPWDDADAEFPIEASEALDLIEQADADALEAR